MVFMFSVFFIIIESWKIHDLKPLCIFQRKFIEHIIHQYFYSRSCRQLKFIRSMVVALSMPCPVFIDVSYRPKTVPPVCRSHDYRMVHVNLKTFVRICSSQRIFLFIPIMLLCHFTCWYTFMDCCTSICYVGSYQ